MSIKKHSKGQNVVKTKILVVDDHPVVRDGLAMLLNCEADMTVVASAGTAAEAVKAVKNHPIDLAIVDMLFKETTGDQITRQIKAISPNLIVLMFSMSSKVLYIQQAFEAGATGYVTKDEVAQEIVNAVHRTLKGQIYLSSSVSKNLTKKDLKGLLAGRVQGCCDQT